jgi:hypothetical protein
VNGQRRDSVGEALRAEGLAGTPAFSKELHGRVMEALRERGLESADLEGGGARASRWQLVLRRVAPLAAAAAVIVVAWLVLKPPAEPTGGGPRETVEMPTVMPRDFMQPVQVAMPTAEAWEEGKYGYLDKDARRFAVFLASQIPSVPEAQAGR